MVGANFYAFCNYDLMFLKAIHRLGAQLEKNGTVCELLATKLHKLVLYKHPNRTQPYSVTSAISRSKRNPV